MTIDSAYFPQRYTKRSTLGYSFTFEVIDPTYVIVYTIDAAGVYTLVNPVNYVVTLNKYIDPIAAGGTVTFNAALASTVIAVSINRKTQIVLDQTFPQGLPFNAESFEFQCDKLTMVLQEINGHVCDCAYTDSLIDANFPITSSVTSKYASASAWVANGYDDDFGMICVNAGASVIAINNLSAMSLMVSTDSGGSWTNRPVYGASGSEDKIISMSCDKAGNNWYIGHTRESTRDFYVSHSANNLVTVNQRVVLHIGSYGHSVFFNPADGFVYVMQGSTLALKRYNQPVTNWANVTTLTFPAFTNRNSWNCLPISDTQMMMFHANQGVASTHAYIFPKDLSGIGVSYPSSINTVVNFATRGKGKALVYRTNSLGVVTYDVLAPGQTSGVAWPTITVTTTLPSIFTAPEIAFGGIGSTLGGTDGMYAMIAVNNVDRTKAEVWFCIGDNFSKWYGPINVTLPNTYINATPAQFIHLRDNKWGFVYSATVSAQTRVQMVEIDLYPGH